MGKRNSLSLLFLATSFPRAFCLCKLGRGSPGPPPGASLLAPLLLPAAGAAPLPPREAPNGYPVSPTGRGLRRRLPPPRLRAAAGTRGGGARGLGAAARRWTRTREAGRPGAGGLGRAPDARPAPLGPRLGARPALTGRPLPL